MTRAGLTVTRGGPGGYSDTPGHLRLTRLTLRLLRALWVRWFVKQEFGPDCPECSMPMEPVILKSSPKEWVGYQCPDHLQWLGGKSGKTTRLDLNDVPLFCRYAVRLKDADGRYIFPPDIQTENERRSTAS